MALMRLLCQEESRQQIADYRSQMGMNGGLQGWNDVASGALASFDRPNQASSSPPMDHNPWLLQQLQQEALMHEQQHHHRGSINSRSIDTNRNHVGWTPQEPTSGRIPSRNIFRSALESPNVQFASPANDAVHTERKAPQSMQPLTVYPQKKASVKTGGAPSPQSSKSNEALSCHFTPRPLAHVNDHLFLSQHQIFLRQQIEVFCATENDINVRTRGRNKRITLGQVGIRCRFCAHLPCRQKGSLYYPSSTLGLYQAAQNMNTTHMQCGLCVAMPDSVKKQFADLIPTKTLGSLRGRSYWSNSAKEMGLVDTVDQGIRYVPPKSETCLPQRGATCIGVFCIYRFELCCDGSFTVRSFFHLLAPYSY
jgi:hypothetical protein